MDLQKRSASAPRPDPIENVWHSRRDYPPINVRTKETKNPTSFLIGLQVVCVAAQTDTNNAEQSATPVEIMYERISECNPRPDDE